MNETNLVGIRLRQERERLGLTQEAFAAACGVSRRAQINYESGERSPGARYLEAAGKIGVDVGYVLYEERTTDEKIEIKALRTVLARVAVLLEVHDLPEAINTAFKHHQQRLQQGVKNDASLKVIMEMVDQALAKSPVLATSDVLASLLSELIERFEQLLDKRSIHLSPSKKARIITMLYRAFVASGKIDQKMIEDAISLARD